MFIYNGFSTIVTFALNPAVMLREREVQPPSLEGRGPIDTTTMRNARVVTKGPKSLYEVGDMTFQANYDPNVYTQIIAMVQVNQAITVRFPDTTTVSFYGFIDKFAPASLKEGEFPLAEVKVVVTSRNGAGAEFGPSIAGGVNIGSVAF